ncbi:MAG: hypothetical protein B7Y45_07610 [Sphingomonas sp. 28-66-16]|nr:MAG: hypothetical protein B7Y45_07610 [Sphingomonas sp. 28-66-16]
MNDARIGALAIGGAMLALGAVAAAPAASPAPASAGSGTGLCTADEVPLFSCAIGARTVSVCGGGAANNAHAQYRYGTPAKVELSSPRQGPNALVFARAAYSGGGELQFSFANGAYRYVVYSRTIRTGFGAGGNKPVFEDGLFVTRGGKLVSDKRCTGRSTAKGDAEAYLHAGEIIYPD